MKKLLPLFFFTAIAGISLSVCGQGSNEKKQLIRIGQLVTDRLKPIAPGCALLIAKDGKIIFEKAFGISNLELNVPMSAESVFRIGSVTKEFTAIAILQLMEQGRLFLTDSIQKYISDFPYKGRTITIENLLTHTSGIMDFQNLNAGIPDVIRIGLPPQRIIDSLKGRPLEFIPGTKYSYSNTNYFLLGMVIEKISGLSYKKYMAEHIFKPMGLNDTRYDDPVTIITSRASGYRKQQGMFLNADYISMNWPYSAGALQSTVGDLYKWHEGIFNDRVIKKETLEKATTNFLLPDGKTSQYGYGFFLRDWQGNKTIGHGGAIDGFRAMEMFVPGKNIYIAMLFNSEEESFLPLFEDVAAIMCGKEMSTDHKDIKIEDATLDNYAGTYTFIENPSMSIKVYKNNTRLYADLSDRSGTRMALLGQTQTMFFLPDVRRIQTTIEFIIENDKVTGLVLTQEAKHRATKTMQ